MGDCANALKSICAIVDLYRRPVAERTRRPLTVAYWLLMLGGMGREKSNRVGVTRTGVSADKAPRKSLGDRRFFRGEVREEGADTDYWLRAYSAFCRCYFRILRHA